MKGKFFDFSFAMCSLMRIFATDMKQIAIISGLLAALFLSFSCGGNPSPDGEAGRRLVLRDEYGTEVYSTAITEETDEITLPSTLSGTYEIRLIRGSLTFGGDIEL